MAINIGDRFSTFSELQDKIQDYQNEKFILVRVGSSRSLSTAAKTTPIIAANANPLLKYYFMNYCCVHGGYKRKSRSLGSRTGHKTYHIGCPMKICIKLSDDLQFLEVAKITEDHNHEITPSVYHRYTRNRKLATSDQKEKECLLNLGSNKKCIHKKCIQVELGKTMNNSGSLRDIHNIDNRKRSKHSEIENLKKHSEIEDLKNFLSSLPDSSAKFITDEENIIQGIFFQDTEMKNVYDSFPEVLIVDSAYDFNNLMMPLYLLIAVDGNGESEIIALMLVSNESSDLLQQMFKLFCNNNPCFVNTKTIFSDNDFTERKVLEECFPSATLLLCLVHVLRAFRRNITKDLMGISAQQSDAFLNIIQQIAYSANETIYNSYVESLTSLNCEKMFQYFLDFWHSIKEQWILCFVGHNVNLNEKTTNRIECIFQKIRQVCHKNAVIGTFFLNFITVLNSLRIESDLRAYNSIYKAPVYHSNDDYIGEYRHYLTAHAFDILLPQLNSYHNVNFQFGDSNNSQSFTYSSHEGEIGVTVRECQCRFHKSNRMPCRHILALRAYNKFDLFDKELVSERWTKSFYMKSHRVFKESRQSALPQIINIPIKPYSKSETLNEKSKKAKIVIDQLAQLIVSSCNSKFENRLKALESICLNWKNDDDVDIIKSKKSSPIIHHDIDIIEENEPIEGHIGACEVMMRNYNFTLNSFDSH